MRCTVAKQQSEMYMGRAHPWFALGWVGSRILKYWMDSVRLGLVVKFSKKHVHNIAVTDIRSRQSAKWKQSS